jgi:hypothetical protein
MTTYRPRLDFLKRVLALPLLATAPPIAAVAARDYDVYLFPVAGFRFHDGPALLERIRPGMALELVPEPSVKREGESWDAVRVAVSMPG